MINYNIINVQGVTLRMKDN